MLEKLFLGKMLEIIRGKFLVKIINLKDRLQSLKHHTKITPARWKENIQSSIVYALAQILLIEENPLSNG